MRSQRCEYGPDDLGPWLIIRYCHAAGFAVRPYGRVSGRPPCRRRRGGRAGRGSAAGRTRPRAGGPPTWPAGRARRTGRARRARRRPARRAPPRTGGVGLPVAGARIAHGPRRRGAGGGRRRRAAAHGTSPPGLHGLAGIGGLQTAGVCAATEGVATGAASGDRPTRRPERDLLDEHHGHQRHDRADRREEEHPPDRVAVRGAHRGGRGAVELREVRGAGRGPRRRHAQQRAHPVARTPQHGHADRAAERPEERDSELAAPMS